jgi:hypothetical protein
MTRILRIGADLLNDPRTSAQSASSAFYSDLLLQRSFSMIESFANILVRQEGRVGVVQLNRPQALNALNSALMDELVPRCKPSTPTTASAASSSPAARKPLPPAPTSSRWPTPAW